MRNSAFFRILPHPHSASIRILPHSSASFRNHHNDVAQWFTADEAQAQAFTDKVQDISTFLDNLGLKSPPALPEPIKLAYHDACHLAQAQGIRSAPRRLLNSIPNVTLLEVPEGDICCGSAGTYNLLQPRLAGELGRRKAGTLESLEPQVVAAGNIGCMMQIGARTSLPVVHTAELLDWATGGPKPRTLEEIAETSP